MPNFGGEAQETGVKGDGSRQRLKTPALILIIVGIASILYSAISDYRLSQEAINYMAAEGIVVGYEEVINSKNRTLHAEIIEYNVGGIPYRIVSPVSKMNPAEIGTNMEVKYNPQNPQKAFLTKAAWQTNIIVLVFGLAALLLGLFILIKQAIISKREAIS